MMSSGSLYTKMSNKVVPYLSKLSHKHAAGGGKNSSYKRVVDDLNRLMMSNNRDKDKTRWGKKESRTSAASIIFNMFGTSNKVNRTEVIKRRFQRVVKARKDIWSGGRGRLLRWFKKGDDHRANSLKMKAEKSSRKISGGFFKVADSKNVRLVQRISGRKQVKRERKGLELCKKRILMGVKCKPVNASGKLHYGRDGVILAEDQAL